MLLERLDEFVIETACEVLARDGAGLLPPARLDELGDMLGDGELTRAQYARQRERIEDKLDAVTAVLADDENRTSTASTWQWSLGTVKDSEIVGHSVRVTRHPSWAPDTASYQPIPACSRPPATDLVVLEPVNSSQNRLISA